MNPAEIAVGGKPAKQRSRGAVLLDVNTGPVKIGQLHVVGRGRARSRIEVVKTEFSAGLILLKGIGVRSQQRLTGDADIEDNLQPQEKARADKERACGDKDLMT